MIHYDIIGSNNLEDLRQRVTNLLNVGWCCQGGVAVIITPSPSSSICYCQAMTKTEIQGEIA